MDDIAKKTSIYFPKEDNYFSKGTCQHESNDLEKDSSRTKNEQTGDYYGDDSTLEYELHEAKSLELPASYSSKDFLTDSEDEMELEKEKPPPTEAEPSHKKLHQLKLDDFNFAGAGGNKRKQHNRHMRWNDADTSNYRDGYPDRKDDPSLKDNLLFYTGRIRSYPDGDFIDIIHTDWFGNYKLLEKHHGYIQWLFPIRESGMNYHAQALQLHEAKAIQEHRRGRQRVLTSFKLMLDFYGMKFDNEETGTISRSINWRERYDNLNRSSHNYLRITRILKSLGELGFEHLKKPFLEFIMIEAIKNKTLTRTLVSCRDYWIGTIKDDASREELYDTL